MMRGSKQHGLGGDKAHQGYKLADCCETENEQQRSQSYQRHHPARLPSAAPQAAEGRSLLPRDQKLRFLPGRIARTIDRTSLSYAYPASQKPADFSPPHVGPAETDRRKSFVTEIFCTYLSTNICIFHAGSSCVCPLSRDRSLGEERRQYSAVSS